MVVSVRPLRDVTHAFLKPMPIFPTFFPAMHDFLPNVRPLSPLSTPYYHALLFPDVTQPRCSILFFCSRRSDLYGL
jgi:hypothetical protein